MFQEAIKSTVELPSTWWKRNYGISHPDPTTADPQAIIDYQLTVKRIILERYHDVPALVAACRDDHPAETFELFGCDLRQVLAQAFGAPELTWSSETGCLWDDRSRVPLSRPESAEEINALPMPDWDTVPAVQKVLNRKQEIEAALPSIRVTSDCVRWERANPNGRYGFVTIPSFIDMGPFLMGDEHFFESLLMRPEMSHALMGRGLQWAVSYNEYMRDRFLHMAGEPVRGVGSMAGDYATMLSPDLYDEYAYGYDHTVMEHFGPDLPTNLHSCGPSAHLYEKWTAYPNVAVLQTRWTDGHLARLRSLMPNTLLEMTFAPPQFDIDHADIADIENLLWQAARDAEFRGVSFHAIFTGVRDNAATDQRLRAFFKTIEDINNSL